MGAGVKEGAIAALGEDEWYSLVSTVQDGSCTLMLGPDAVTGTLDGERLPIHVALATYMVQRLPSEIRDRLGSRFDYLDPARPASVAQMVLREIDRRQVKRWLEDFRGAFRPDASPLDDLARLPFELVINTSPATAVYDVFHAANEDTNTTFYDRTGRAPGLMPDPEPEKPVVYQLYGSLDNPRSLILSDTDRLDFIVGLARDNPPLPVNLTSILHDDDRSFLFLGFDLADWHLRVLLHILSQAANRNYTSFAAELDASPLEPADRDFYRLSHKIHFFSGDLSDFAGELRQRVDEERASEPSSRRAAHQPLPANAPTVFICHASEDAEHARRIADGLRASGIGTWVDAENLRGGEHWNQMIERTIRNDVSYVVVVQSAAMRDKDVGYVNREINMALDRQREYRFPRVFVIPATIDGDRLDLAEFEQLQSVDVSPDAGVSHLTRAILRDLDLAERGTR